MNREAVTAKNVDLSNCDREQVQFSGAIQPHGCMLVIEEPSLRILQASANCHDFLGVPPEKARETTLAAVVPSRFEAIALRLSTENLDNGPVHLASLNAQDTLAGRPFHLFGHRCGGATILEFEVLPDEDGWPMLDLYSDLRTTMAQLHAAPSLQSFFDFAVAQIRRFTGFERVMAYKFLEDGSGHVIAEFDRRRISSLILASIIQPATFRRRPAACSRCRGCGICRMSIMRRSLWFQSFRRARERRSI